MKKRIKKILIPDSGTPLSHRAVKGSLWLFLSRYSSQVLNIIKIVFLARLLSPGDFGIFSVVAIAISLFESFSQIGFTQALIQKKKEIRDYFDTAWVVKAIRGLLLVVLLFVFSNSIASFFAETKLSLIIKIVSLTVFLDGISSVAFVYAFRELQFHKYFIYQTAGSIADLVFSASFALIFRNYWALVAGFLASAAVKFLASYFIYPYLPRFSFDKAKAIELLNFGKWIFGSNIIGFFISQGESIFVGKFLGIASLGFYQMAYKASSFLNMEIISGALFPVYSKMQENHEAIKNAYIKTVRLSSLIFVPAAGGIFILASDFTEIFLGEKWLPIVSALQILTWSSLAWSFNVITSPLFQALGKPKIETFLNGVRLVLLLILAYPFIMVWGISGAAFAVLAGAAASTVGALFFIANIINLKLKDFGSAFLLPSINTIIMIVVVHYSMVLFPAGMPLFFGAILLGAIIYFLLMLIGEKIFKIRYFCLLKEVLSLLAK